MRALLLFSLLLLFVTTAIVVLDAKPITKSSSAVSYYYYYYHGFKYSSILPRSLLKLQTIHNKLLSTAMVSLLYVSIIFSSNNANFVI
jgi:hypothetical protein